MVMRIAMMAASDNEGNDDGGGKGVMRVGVCGLKVRGRERSALTGKRSVSKPKV